MKEHVKLGADNFAVKWVTMGVRVEVNCAPQGRLPSMTQLASFTIGGTWKLNEDALKKLAPLVNASALQARFDDS